jgi:hypothetical protein
MVDFVFTGFNDACFERALWGFWIQWDSVHNLGGLIATLQSFSLNF